MACAGTNRLTARSANAGTFRLAGSLTASAPGGIVTEARPPNVNVLAESGLISPPPALSAIFAAPTVSGSSPNSLLTMIRTAGPPSDTWTISRNVVSAPPNFPALFDSATGDVAHVPTQRSPRGPAALAGCTLKQQRLK